MGGRGLREPTKTTAPRGFASNVGQEPSGWTCIHFIGDTRAENMSDEVKTIPHRGFALQEDRLTCFRLLTRLCVASIFLEPHVTKRDISGSATVFCRQIFTVKTRIVACNTIKQVHYEIGEHDGKQG